MTLVAKVDGVALPDGALLISGAPNSTIPGGIQGLPTSAYYGEALFGGLSIDDPEGAYDFDGLHTFTVDETADTARPRIWNGLLAGRRVHRGPYKSGVSRVWDVDIWEMNLLFALMVFRSSSAKRPAETDLVRMQYIMESAPMAFTPSVDNGRANYTDNPVAFDDADLVTRYPIEGINEFVGIAGKNFYNYWDHDEEENSIHYDQIGVGPAATITVTNDEGDTLDSTTFRPFLDAELDEGAEWTVTGMLLGYRGAYAYGIRQATIDALSPTEFSPTEFQRDEVYRTDRIGRASTAASTIQSMLADRATDRATLKFSIRVPAAVVNEGTEAGHLITVKFTHLPGYETEIDLPIIRRNVIPTEGRTDLYDIHLECSGVGIPSGPGGGDPGPFPNQNPCDIDNVDIVQTNSAGIDGSALPVLDGASWGTPPVAGNMLVSALLAFAQQGFDAGTMAGWDKVVDAISFTGLGGSGGNITIWTRVADGTEPTTPTITGSSFGAANIGKSNHYLIELAGVDAIDGIETGVNESSDSLPGVTITPSAGLTALIMTFMEEASYTAGGFVPFSGVTELVHEDNISGGGNPGRMILYKAIDGTTGTYDINGQQFAASPPWLSATITFYCSGSENTCPAAGVWVDPPEVVTLTGADGTTRCPFADGSLHVYIDNVEQTDTLVSQDGTTGDFTLGFDPTPTEVCTVRYQGR